MKRLTQLVVASCVSALMDKSVAGYDLPAGDLWRHSVAVSIACETMVKDQKRNNHIDVFTPALLHDIGKLVLGSFVSEELEAIQQIAGKGIPFVVAENMVLGTDHAEIGARILKRWNLPAEVINAVRWHHDPDSADACDFQMDVVYLANLLCQTSETTVAAEGSALELSATVIDRLGIEMDQFETISDKVGRWVDELSAALAFN
jgi:putative nucleotidyltransferase with HDIG domain